MSNKNKFINKTTKVGTYTLLMALVILAVIVVINLVVNRLPGEYTKFDITALNLYTLSDVTKEAIPKIDEEITVYLFCEDGTDSSGSSINNLPTLSAFLGKYIELNDKITLKIIDPVAQPTFQDKYTSEAIENYTLIFESEKRHKVVNFSDLYYYYSESFGQMTAEEYSQYASYLQYYGDESVTLYFNGESIITSALDFVTTDSLPVLYALNGHGEAEFSSTLTSRIEAENMIVTSLSLLSSDIPEDAECIIINAPQRDLNSDEAEKLSQYLKDGGHLFVTTVYQYLDLPNLMSVLEEFGVTAQKGMIIEGSSANYYSGYPYYLLPKVSTTNEITAPLASSYYMFAPYSHAILKTEQTPENVTVTDLFNTTSSAYTIDAASESIDKTESSITGQFTIAVSAENSETNGKIVWVASPAFTDNFNSITNGNYSYMMSMLNWMNERERIVQNIPSTSLASSYLVVSEAAANIWAALLIVIIPCAFAFAGVVRWYVRRKR